MSEPIRDYVRETSLRYSGPRIKAPAMSNPKAVAAFFAARVDGDGREFFMAIYLNQRHHPIGYSTVSIGCATSSLVHPREVFAPGLMLGACALVIAHNHPSGVVDPSSEDRQVTARIAEGGKLLGVRLLDHLIVNDSGKFFSFVQSGMLATEGT